jgi:hypothetical protein
MKKYILYLLLLCPIQLAIAGGWPQPKGNGYFKLGQSSIVAKQYYDTQGNKVDIRTLGNYTTALYGEYGFTERFTGIVFFPFFVRNTVNEVKGNNSGNVIQEGIDYNNIGDLDIGFRYGLVKNKPFALSVALTLGIPTGNGDHPEGLNTGDGEFNQLLKLEFGKSLGAKFYLSTAVGINNRSKGFSDEFRYEGEIGWQPSKKWWLIFKAQGIKPLNNGETSTTGGSNGLFMNGTQFLSFGPEIAFQLTPSWGLNASTFGAVDIKNALGAPSFNFGVFWKLQK